MIRERKRVIKIIIWMRREKISREGIIFYLMVKMDSYDTYLV